MVKIRQMLLNPAKYAIKAPYKMTPQFITIHNTANDASANNEARYHNSNNNQVSYHYAVDDKEIVQVIPDNRNAWHCGDGNGNGNRKSIGIEICYSKSGGTRYEKAEDNAVKLTAFLLKKYNLPISAVKQHYDWSRKNCPHRIRANGTWQKFINEVKAELARLNGGATTAKAPAKTTAKPTATKTLYRIQTGTFATKKEAERAKQKMADNNLANINYINVHQQGRAFYLTTGTYVDLATAERYLKRMKDLKIIWVGNVVKA